MAIRNNLLGGTDFGNENLGPTDLNDTFDAVVDVLGIPDDITLEVSSGNSSIKAGGVSFDKLGDDLDKWELLETLTPSAVATITSSSLPVKKNYKVVIDSLFLASSADFALRINGDTTANGYGGMKMINLVNTWETAQAQAVLGSLINTYANGFNIYLAGKAPTITDGRILGHMTGTGIANASNDDLTFNFYWKAGSAVQLDNVTFFSSSNFAGVIRIYGRD